MNTTTAPTQIAHLVVKKANRATVSTTKASFTPTSTVKAPVTLSRPSARSHKRGISAATPRTEREREEVTERSRRGRLLRPTKKASKVDQEGF